MAEAKPSGDGQRPHPVLNASTFPRIRAQDQALAKQAAFADFYPNGLPVVYKMRHGYDSQGIPRHYVEDSLPVGFYTNPPADAKAIFSTMRGEHAFRRMKHLLPARRIHLWTSDEVQSACNSIRQVFWDAMRPMTRPYCWDDMWTYFDAADLYHYGALNLWNVVNHLYDENQIIFRDVAVEQALLIGQWADGWLKSEDNRRRLMAWTEAQGPIYSTLTADDTESLGTIQDDVIPLIASALKHRRSFLVHGAMQTTPSKPMALLTARGRDEVQNWMGKSTASGDTPGRTQPPYPLSPASADTPAPVGQRVFEVNGLPPRPATEKHREPSDWPCFVSHRGKHYFLPPGAAASAPKPPRASVSNKAVLDLTKSAAAASNLHPAPVRERAEFGTRVNTELSSVTEGSDEAVSSADCSPAKDREEEAGGPRWWRSKHRSLEELRRSLTSAFVRHGQRRLSDSALEETNHKFFREEPRALLAGAAPVTESVPSSLVHRMADGTPSPPRAAREAPVASATASKQLRAGPLD